MSDPATLPELRRNVYHFDALIPVGSRTTCDLPGKSGSFQHSWLDTDVPEYMTEERNLRSGNLEPRLNRQQHLDALGVFQSLKRRAAKGQLPIGTTPDSPAKVMQSLSYLIELRPKLSMGARPPRLFRLYYAEPANVQDALLPLVLSTKPNGPDLQQEQNASIDDAKARSRVWELTKAMKGKK